MTRLLSLAVAAGLLASTAGGSADVAPPVPEFDADAAYALLRRQVEFGPRAPNSAGHRAQLAWMQEYLRTRADTVITQRFVHDARGTQLQLANVFARFRPELPRRVLLLAHWDTRPTADFDEDATRQDEPIPGANDGASGTAVLLQLAEILAREDAPVGVDLLFTDGEDYPGHMYLGAKYFAANLGGYRPMYGVLLDMVGDLDPRFPVEGNSRDRASDVVDRVWSLAQQLGLGEYFPQERGIYLADDHLPLNDAGIPTINIIDFEYGPGNAYWHTHRDALENTGPLGLGVVGRLMVALIYRGG